MSIKALLAGLPLAALPTFAHAEGNYSGNLFALVYMLVAALVVIFQALYMLCMSGPTIGRRMVWALWLFMIDAALLYCMSELEVPMDALVPYILVALPGFFLPKFFQKHFSGK